MPVETAHHAPEATGGFTWICRDCPHCAGPRRWDTLQAAAEAAGCSAPRHAIECPGQERLLAIGAASTAQVGRASVAIAHGDPKEVVAVRVWALLVARGVAATVAYRARGQECIDFARSSHIVLMADAAVAIDPMPGVPPIDCGRLEGGGDRITAEGKWIRSAGTRPRWPHLHRSWS